MSTIVISSISIANNADVVTVNSGESLVGISAGSQLFLASKLPIDVESVNIATREITLDGAWTQGDVDAQPCAAITLANNAANVVAKATEQIESLVDASNALTDRFQGVEGAYQSFLGARFTALRTMVNGAIPFETLSLLNAAGSPTAQGFDTDRLTQVVNDPTASNNRIYFWNGANWEVSKYSPPSLTQNIDDESLVDVPSAAAVRKFSQIDNMAAAGANLLDVDTALDGYLMEPDGSLVINASYRVSDYIKVAAGQTYSVWVEATGPNPIAITNYLRKTCYFDEHLNVVAGGSSDDVHSFTVPAGAKYLKASVYNEKLGRFQTIAQGTTAIIEPYYAVPMRGENKTVSNTVFNGKVVQEGADDDSIASHLTINTKLKQYGKVNNLSNNLADPAYFVADTLVQTNGTLKADATYSTSGFVAVDPDDIYYFLSTESSSVGRRYAFYDASYDFVSYVDNASYTSPITVPSTITIKYVRFSFRTAAAFVGCGKKIIIESYVGGLFDQSGTALAVAKTVNAVAIEESEETNAIIGKSSIQNLIDAAGVNLAYSPVSEVNLLAPGTQTAGFMIDDDGTIIENASYAYSENIPVVAGETYTGNYNSLTFEIFRKSCFFDAFGNVVLGGSDVFHNSFTVPTGAKFVVVSVQVSKTYANLCLQHGTSTDFVAYNSKFYVRVKNGSDKTFTDDDDIASRADVLNEIAIATDSIINEGRLSEVNIIVPGTETVGYFVYEYGTIAAGAAYSYSENIPVVAGQTYTGNYNGSTFEVFRKSCFFDQFGAMVTGGNADFHNSFTVPGGAVSVIVSVRSDRDYGLHCLQLGTSTDYAAYSDAKYARINPAANRSYDNPLDLATKQDVDTAINSLGLTSSIAISTDNLVVTIGAFSIDDFSFSGNSVNCVPDLVQYIVLATHTKTLHALDRLLDNTVIPILKVTASANAVAIDKVYDLKLPKCRLPVTAQKMARAEAVQITTLGTSLIRGAGSSPRWPEKVFNNTYSASGFNPPAIDTITFTNSALGGTDAWYNSALIANTMFATSDDGTDSRIYAIDNKSLQRSGSNSDINTISAKMSKSNVMASDLVIVGILPNGGYDQLPYIEAVIRRLRQHDIEVIMVTDNEYKSVDLIYDKGGFLKSVADKYGCALVDTAAFFKEQNDIGNDPYYDGIHQNDIGHNAWATGISGALSGYYSSMVYSSVPQTMIAEDDFPSKIDLCFDFDTSVKSAPVTITLGGNAAAFTNVFSQPTGYTALSVGQVLYGGHPLALGFYLIIDGGSAFAATISTNNGATTSTISVDGSQTRADVVMLKDVGEPHNRAFSLTVDTGELRVVAVAYVVPNYADLTTDIVSSESISINAVEGLSLIRSKKANTVNEFISISHDSCRSAVVSLYSGPTAGDIDTVFTGETVYSDDLYAVGGTLKQYEYRANGLGEMAITSTLKGVNVSADSTTAMGHRLCVVNAFAILDR